MDMFKNIFLRELREEKKLSQEFVAKKIGISRQTYIEIEKGNAELSISQAQKIAELFDVSLENLVPGKKEKTADVVLERENKKIDNDMQIRVTHKNLNKFKQVLLYILEKVGGKPNVGETVLHKLLYFIDFDYYEKFEENLMGATYIKNHHGPTSIELSAILKEMQKKGEIEAVNSKYFKYEQKKYLPRKHPDLEKFSAREIEHIDDVLARLSAKNAKEIEIYSHGDIPWKSAEDGKQLSYESVFYRDEKYSIRNYEDEI